ncbi:MAG: hypothetical protein Q9181_001984 [Wetmoreana brouardii]
MVKVHDRTVTDILLLLATVLVYVGAQATVGALGRPASSLTAPSTCLFTSINHITQTLPQQCLATSWTGKREESEGENAQPTDNEASVIRSTQGIVTNGQSTWLTNNESLHKQPTETAAPVASTTSGDDLRTEAVAKGTVGDTSDGEADSPLDNAHFLSFEEWKSRNLAKAGQSAENLGAGRSGAGEPRRRPAGINNALDSLGEDTEIEIDFAGFVNPPASSSGAHNGEQRVPNRDGGLTGKNGDKKTATELTGAHARSKDAGVTCKERSNYASFDCAATMLKTNPECKSATSVLVENKDSYMLNLCSADNKFFIVELCNDILVDTVVLANFEFFSSIFRTFRVSVSDRYPVKLDKWRELGTFEAKNSRGIQAFLVEEPQIWARYLRIEFLTHYGHEYYCPVSLLRVHGTTMMEEFNHELKMSKGEDDSESAVDEGLPQEARSVQDVVTADALKRESETNAQGSAPTATPAPEPSTTWRSVEDDGRAQMQPYDASKPVESFSSNTPFNNTALAHMHMIFLSASRGALSCRPSETPAESSRKYPAHPTSGNMTVSGSASSSVPSSAPASTISQATETTAGVTTSSSFQTTSASNLAAATVSSISERPDDARSKGNGNTNFSKIASQSSQSSSKAHTTSTHPSVPNPTTQESFFKSVHKRLQLLESNSTLSLQYIEEQSRILRDAFAKVEKRQLAKTTSFLETLNTTVLDDVRAFREQYDQIWQSTVLELSSQRQQSRREIEALSSRLTLLADELLFQKRIAILQFLLILLCLGLAFFSRGSAAVGVNYLEHVVNKSSINLSRYASQLDSPPASPSSTRPPSRYGFFSRMRSFDHRRSPSEETMGDGAKSPSIEYSPPTPTSLQSEESGHGSPRSDDHSGLPNGSMIHDRTNGLLSPVDLPESSSSAGSTPSNDAGQGSS